MRIQEPGQMPSGGEAVLAYAALNSSSAAEPLPQPELRLAERAVIIHKRSARGHVLRIAVPIGHYRGVSADIRHSGEILTCAIVMAHENTDFELTLFSASDDENILAEWNAWSQKLLLPMMIRTEHGDVTARQQFGPLTVGAVSPRRARSQFLARRPRFLRQRETGVAEHLEVHQGREIIARD